mmetsp:Transcript_72953/g.134768  ORF Transcript_72953/g.134768 Transcript_72953/m.134768 type:complete len:203 (+) Transcript_72953:204-812(+)
MPPGTSHHEYDTTKGIPRDVDFPNTHKQVDRRMSMVTRLLSPCKIFLQDLARNGKRHICRALRLRQFSQRWDKSPGRPAQIHPKSVPNLPPTLVQANQKAGCPRIGVASSYEQNYQILGNSVWDSPLPRHQSKDQRLDCHIHIGLGNSIAKNPAQVSRNEAQSQCNPWRSLRQFYVQGHQLQIAVHFLPKDRQLYNPTSRFP